MAQKENGVVLEWDAHAYEHKERSTDWYWAVGITTVGLVLAAVILGNILFGLLILVSAVSLSLFINRPPETIHIAINGAGVRRDNVMYPFETLAAFWIDLDHPHKKILLRSQKKFMPLIIIPISEEVNTEKLHTHLSTKLIEEYHSLPFVEKVLEYVGF